MQTEETGAGADKIRCPACGARNSPGAEWCGQCLTRFAPPPPPPGPSPALGSLDSLESLDSLGAAAPWASGFADATMVRPPAPVSDLTLEGDADAGGPSADLSGARVISQRGAFTATDAGVLWTCARCGTQNPLEAESCSVCGATLAELVRPPAKPRPARDPGTTALISLFFPGAGHAYLGMWGDFVARGILQVWVVGVTLLTAAQGGGTLVAIVFGVAAFGLWVVAAHDAFREANNEPSAAVLKGRVYMWVVLGLLGLLIVGILLSALTGPVSRLPEDA